MDSTTNKSHYLKLVETAFPEANGKAAERILYNWSPYLAIEKCGVEITEREFLERLMRVRTDVENGKPWDLGIILRPNILVGVE